MSKHPGITLEFIIMGWDDYVKKTQTMILANEADVFQVPGISMMSDMDVLEPLQPYIDRDGFDLTQYFDGQVDGWKIMGPNDAEPTIYALPFLGDTRYICYDKTISTSGAWSTIRASHGRGNPGKGQGHDRRQSGRSQQNF